MRRRRRYQYTVAVIVFVLLVTATGFTVHAMTSRGCSSACVYAPPIVAAAPDNANEVPPTGAALSTKSAAHGGHAPNTAPRGGHVPNTTPHGGHAPNTLTSDGHAPNTATSDGHGRSTGSFEGSRVRAVDCCTSDASHDPTATSASASRQRPQSFEPSRQVFSVGASQPRDQLRPRGRRQPGPAAQCRGDRVTPVERASRVYPDRNCRHQGRVSAPGRLAIDGCVASADRQQLCAGNDDRVDARASRLGLRQS